jgi:hypothetical protein
MNQLIGCCGPESMIRDLLANAAVYGARIKGAARFSAL